MTSPSFGKVWFSLLDEEGVEAGTTNSLLTGSTTMPDGRRALLAAIVPDSTSPFPRARGGEVGLRESLQLASWVRSLDDAAERPDQPLVLVIDVPSQAYGYVEELFGLNATMATAINALASERLRGRPVISLVVGKAISGAFLATGLQANRIVMLDHDGVQVQVMGKQAAARITRRTVQEMDEVAERVPATAFDGRSFATLGAVFDTVVPQNAETPTPEDRDAVSQALARAVDDVQRSSDSTLRSRLESGPARNARVLSRLVRDRVNAEW